MSIGTIERAGLAAQVPPIYLLVERRTDGHMRILGEFRDPDAALANARLLRWAGSPAQILLASQIEDAAP